MLSDFLRYHHLLARGEIRFPDEMCGKNIICKDRPYRVFLQVRKTSDEGVPSAKVFLRITFTVKRLNFLQKRLIPVWSIPFFAGFPGFLSKMFCVNEENKSLQGLYEWESRHAAERYIGSYPMKFMRRNAAPGSISCEIRENGWT